MAACARLRMLGLVTRLLNDPVIVSCFGTNDKYLASQSCDEFTIQARAVHSHVVAIIRRYGAAHGARRGAARLGVVATMRRSDTPHRRAAPVGYWWGYAPRSDRITQKSDTPSVAGTKTSSPKPPQNLADTFGDLRCFGSRIWPHGSLKNYAMSGGQFAAGRRWCEGRISHIAPRVIGRCRNG